MLAATAYIQWVDGHHSRAKQTAISALDLDGQCALAAIVAAAICQGIRAGRA